MGVDKVRGFVAGLRAAELPKKLCTWDKVTRVERSSETGALCCEIASFEFALRV